MRSAASSLSPLAVAQLFDELGLAPEVAPAGPLTRFAAPGIEVFAGDIFELTPEKLGPVAAVYDRAALIALPPALRPRYADHLAALAPGAPQLLITLEYDQSLMDGPPFSVGAEEVRRLYAPPPRGHAARPRADPQFARP